jgi:predicted lactoylglutathione lyase
MAHATRQSKWKNAPKELFDHIVEVNDEFVKRLEKQLSDLVADAKKNVDALKGLVSSLKAVFDGDEKNEAIAAEEEQLQNAEKEYQAISKDPLAAAVKKDADLKAISKEFLSRWKSGFFELPWELVKELHEENFLWGATFDDPDLHHFEL